MLLHSNIIGAGTPLVILHGFLGMGDNWKTLAKQFSEANFQVHLVDQRNHGRSFHDNDFDLEILADDLKNYCQYHNLQDIILLGHSMGGKTAMLFAAQFPEIVARLIIADIAPRYYPIHHETILAGLLAIDFEQLQTRKEADEILAHYVTDFGTRQFLLKNLYWVEKGQLGLRINLPILAANVGEIGEALPTNHKFEKPTLFLRGDKSEYIGTSDEVLIKMQFPNALIKTVSNAGHWLHAENPQEFYQFVTEFIK